MTENASTLGAERHSDRCAQAGMTSLQPDLPRAFVQDSEALHIDNERCETSPPSLMPLYCKLVSYHYVQMSLTGDFPLPVWQNLLTSAPENT